MKNQLTPERAAYLKQHYANTPNKELAEYCGVTIRTIIRYGSLLGLHKSREYLDHAKWKFQKGEGIWQRFKTDEEKEGFRQRIANSLKDIVKAERRRILFGLPQKTKMRVVRATRAKLKMRTNLRKHGYIIEHGSNDAYINQHTQRSNILEQRAEDKFCIRFYYTENYEPK